MRKETGVMKALEGVKIADFTWVAAGPLTTVHLANYGATVVRVESATRPDGMRTFPPNKDNIPGVNRSLLFAHENGNKFSATFNLNDPKGMDVAKRLIAWADVVSENFRPGQMEKWGLGYENLVKINPSIIMFRSSAQGQTGRYSRLGTIGNNLHSLTGFTYITGWPDREPVPPWGAFTDVTVPTMGVAMIAAALEYRDRTGEGQCLDLSQYEASLHYLAPAILDYEVNGRVAGREGNSCSYAAPHGVYRCKGDDRWCSIAVFDDKEWNSFCDVLGRPPWTDSPDFSTLLARKENESKLNFLVEKWTMHHEAEEVMTLMQDADISAGLVENGADMLYDPQFQERGFYQRLNHSEMGDVIHRGAASQLSETPWAFDRPSPCMGEHTEYVCREFLKMSDEEFVELLNSEAFK
jgi:benzylsuccinate CoA-transferase BbsF subunit